MTSSANHWKIGLFVSGGLLAGVVCLFWAGYRLADRPREPRVTYFDESVQGLDVGAPVKMRGVNIGVVQEITIAPDRRLVKVTAQVYVDLWVRLGLGTEAELASAARPLPSDLRVQLASTGITGEKFLLVDFFSAPGPPPELSFEPPYNYIPSTPSTLKSLEDGVNELVDLLPRTLEGVDTLVGTLDRKIGGIDTADLSERTVAVLEEAHAFFDGAGTTLEELQLPQVQADLKELLTGTTATLERVDGFLARLDSKDGAIQAVVADFDALTERARGLMDALQDEVRGAELAETSGSLRATSDAFGGVAREAATFSSDARATLVRLRETLASVQALAALLERQPGALLRGHPTEFPPPDRR